MRCALRGSFLLLLLLLMHAACAYGQDSTAESAQAACAHWAKVHVDGKTKGFKGSSENVYQTGVCFGYFAGLMDGIDNTSGWGDGKADYLFHIDRQSINSIWDVITAFYKYVSDNPLSKGKPAWKVLQTVLIENHLAGFQKVSSDAQASVQ
jgi:hypothetical protein